MRGHNEMKDPSAVTVFLLRYSLICLWALLAWAMWRSWQRDPFDYPLTPMAASGHRPPGALLVGVGMTAAELALVYAAFRPWRPQGFRRIVIGGLLVLIVLLPLTALGLIASIHAGAIHWLHLGWLFLLDTVLVSVLAIALLRRFLQRRYEREQAA